MSIWREFLRSEQVKSFELERTSDFQLGPNIMLLWTFRSIYQFILSLSPGIQGLTKHLLTVISRITLN